MHGNKEAVYKGGYKRRFSDLATRTQARYFLNEENHRLHKTDISDISIMIPTLLFLGLLAGISGTVSSANPGLQIQFAQGGIDRGKCKPSRHDFVHFTRRLLKRNDQLKDRHG